MFFGPMAVAVKDCVTEVPTHFGNFPASNTPVEGKYSGLTKYPSKFPVLGEDCPVGAEIDIVENGVLTPKDVTVHSERIAVECTERGDYRSAHVIA